MNPKTFSMTLIDVASTVSFNFPKMGTSEAVLRTSFFENDLLKFSLKIYLS